MNKPVKPSIELIDNVVYVPSGMWRERLMAEEPEGKVVFVDFSKKRVVSETEWMGYAIKIGLKSKSKKKSIKKLTA
jgi:hypothetical protein